MLLIFSTPVLIRHLWQHKTVVFLHRSLTRAVPLENSASSRRSGCKDWLRGTNTTKLKSLVPSSSEYNTAMNKKVEWVFIETGFHQNRFSSKWVFIECTRKDCFQVKSNLLTDFRFTTHMNITILN